MKNKSSKQFLASLAAEHAVDTVNAILRAHEDLRHIQATKRGNKITLGSTDEAGARVLHARLEQMDADTWALSLPRHSGRWEQTPFQGYVEGLMGFLLEDFRCWLTL